MNVVLVGSAGLLFKVCGSSLPMRVFIGRQAHPVEGQAATSLLFFTAYKAPPKSRRPWKAGLRCLEQSDQYSIPPSPPRPEATRAGTKRLLRAKLANLARNILRGNGIALPLVDEGRRAAQEAGLEQFWIGDSGSWNLGFRTDPGYRPLYSPGPWPLDFGFLPLFPLPVFSPLTLFVISSTMEI
jgi:hypothetical protein